MSCLDHFQRKRAFALHDADALAHATSDDAINPELGEGNPR